MEASARIVAISVIAVLLALAAPVAPAGAVSSVAPAARGLEESRLYVDAAVAETVDAATQRRLRRALAQRSEPILVALVAFAPGDSFGGDGPRFLTALAGRVGRPGIYVTYDARGILWTRGFRVPRPATERAQVAAHTVDLESEFDSLPGPRLTSFLAALDDPNLATRERAAAAAFRERVGSTTVPSTAPADEDGGGGGAAGLAVVAGAVALLALGVFLVRRRRGARHVDDKPVLPSRVFELAREASRDELAERADATLIALSELIDAAPPDAATQRALDGYEAAERVLRGDDPDVPDLVGALVCIDLARAALLGTAAPALPCTYDPRHGTAQGRPVPVDGTKLRLCKSCRADARAGRPADVLRDGSGRPYLHGDSPWAASGFGAWADPIRAVLDRRR